MTGQQWHSVPEGRVVIFAEFGGEMRAVEGFGSVELRADSGDSYESIKDRFPLHQPQRRYSARVELGTHIKIYARETPPAPEYPIQRIEQPPRQVEP